MSEPFLTAPSDDELQVFAELRCRDDIVRRLYLGLARESAAWVARVGDEAVGIIFTSTREDETFVHELFVRPGYRKAGLGSRLLEEATRGAQPLFSIVDATDAASQAFAIRHGAAMRGALLRCTGNIPSEEELLRLAASESRRFEVAPLEGGKDRLAIETLEREVRGVPLGADHALLGLLASASAFFFNGELVGYAYVWPDGRIGPLAASSSSYEEQIFAFALAMLARRYGASWTQCLVPGENTRVLRAAVRCGLVVEMAWLVARQRANGDPSRYVACHPLLY